MSISAEEHAAAKEYQERPAKPSDDERPAELSDDALARRFTELHGNNLRYVAAWGKWLLWDGNFWKPDDTLHVFDLAREVCREAAGLADKPGTVNRVSSAQSVAAVERLARADRQHAATAQQWDSNLWALNTPGGMVDLRSGLTRPAFREDYCTKKTAVGPGGECTLWHSFLERVTGSNSELEEFIQRVCGYCLTGITWEHALFFLYGLGANGKSVFLNTISGLMDDYARTAPIEVFIASTSEHHPTDLAGLQGARLVTAVETEDGRRWAESKLKSLTGGDRIAARFMRQDFFEFIPQFKLLIAGNHKPGLRSVDEAMRRRFNLVPFTVAIPEPERDAQLTEKLRGEWGGILQWAIDGCLLWQRDGLNPPEAVLSATESYLAAEDAMGRWLEDCCDVAAGNWTASSALFQSWKNWSDTNEEYCGSQRRFSQNLESHGFAPERSMAARGFRGICLRELV